MVKTSKSFLQSLLVAVVLLFTGCSTPYTDLEHAFRVKSTSETQSLSPVAIEIESAKDRRVHKYGSRALTVKVTNAAIEIEPHFPLAPALHPIRIPVDRVAACTKTCFGQTSWTADLLIPDPATQLSFQDAAEVLDWCWRVQIPAVSSGARRKWMYEHSVLPERSSFQRQFPSRADYERTLALSCSGK